MKIEANATSCLRINSSMENTGKKSITFTSMLL